MAPVGRRLGFSEGWEARLEPLFASFERPLRTFTERLLRNDAWLWVFYMHLAVLYTIVASYLATSAPNPVAPAECVQAQMKQLGVSRPG